MPWPIEGRAAQRQCQLPISCGAARAARGATSGVASAVHPKYSASLWGGVDTGGSTSAVVRSTQRGNGASGTWSPSLSNWKAACSRQNPSVLLKGPGGGTNGSVAHQ